MRKHTPEPWRVAARALVRLDSAYLVEPVDHHDYEYGATLAATSQHDARRIVACVNACAGMRNDELEGGLLIGVMQSKIDRLECQRDELLAALQGMIDIANDSQGVAGYHLNGEVADWGEFEEWQAACDAIAKTKGGAANHFPEVTKMAPDGWQLVPVAATKAMWAAWDSAPCNNDDDAVNLEAAYRAMISAAPKLPVTPSGWVGVSKSLPEVQDGEELHCFVCHHNNSTGKDSVFDCYYVNKPIPGDDDDWESIEDNNGRPIAIVGWYFKGALPDYSYYYEPVCDGVTDWQPVIYPAAPKLGGE